MRSRRGSINCPHYRKHSKRVYVYDGTEKAMYEQKQDAIY